MRVQTEYLTTVMPFGKYKGMSVQDILIKDISYLKWLYKERNALQSNRLKEAIIHIVEKVGKANIQNKPVFESFLTKNGKSVKELLSDVKDLPKYLMEHQKVAVAIADKNDKYGFFYECGLGKTLVAIEIIARKKVKAIVVCPISIIVPAWIADIQKFRPEIRVCNLYPMSYNKRIQHLVEMQDDYDVYIINYEGFKIIYEDLSETGIRMLIVDESSKMKNPQSQISIALHEFAQQMDYVYLLSGTPAPNSPLEYYMQINSIAPDLLGESYWEYRNKYFFQPNPKRKWKWLIRNENKYQILQKIQKVSIFMSKDDVIDLPEKTFITRYVEMTDEQMEIYNDYLMTLRESIRDDKPDLASIMKLRQITSGFIYQEQEDNKPVVAVPICDNKFDELKSLLEEIGNKQVIIWINFKYEAIKIKKMLGDKALELHSEITQKQKLEAIQLFQDKKVQYLIAHPSSAGHGLTFTNCSYAIYFSLNYSLELWLQSIDRIHRYGQRNKCTYYILLAQDSIDYVIYNRLAQKKEVSADILDNLKVVGIKKVAMKKQKIKKQNTNT